MENEDVVFFLYTESNVYLMYTCTHNITIHEPENGDTWKMCKLKVLLVENCLRKSSSCLLKNLYNNK